MAGIINPGKDISWAYLKVAILLMNENPDENFGLGLNRPVRLEDLDNLSSESMMKIILFLAGSIIGDKPLSKVVSLTEFNTFGVGDVTYDCALDQVYQALRPIFPENDDHFHFSVLLLPSRDPRKTRVFISYIMAFVLMCDDMHNAFDSCYNDVAKENQEKVRMYTEIEELKESISNIIQQREADKQRIPSLQQEIKNLEQEIRRKQEILSKMLHAMGKEKSAYESKEREIRQLEKKIDEKDAEIRNLENQIVSGHLEIAADNNTIKMEIEKHTRERKSVGAELEKLQKESDAYESLKDRAVDTLQSFESVIAAMKSIKERIESYTRSGNEFSVLARRIDHIRKEGEKLAQSHKDELQKTKYKNGMHETRMEDTRNALSELKLEIRECRIERRDLVNKVGQIQASFQAISDEIDKLTDEISQREDEVVRVIPQAREQLAQEAQQLLLDLRRPGRSKK